MRDVYLILGGSSDIGINVLKQLEGTNALVYATFCTHDDKLNVAREVSKNVEIVPIKCDLSDPYDVSNLIDVLSRGEEPITHIINLSASEFNYMRIKSWDTPKVKKELEIGVLSFAEICGKFVPKMAKNGYGKVVALASSYVVGVPPKFMADYIMVKYALVGYVKALAAEYAGKGINANLISPSMMETGFLKNIDERMIEADAENSMMGRHVTTEEVAKNILFLCSENSNYMNGVNLVMSGGDVMQ